MPLGFWRGVFYGLLISASALFVVMMIIGVFN